MNTEFDAFSIIIVHRIGSSGPVSARIQEGKTIEKNMGWKREKGEKKKRRQRHERKAEAAKLLLNGRAQSLRADANG